MRSQIVVREHGVAVLPNATLRIQSPHGSGSERHVMLDASGLQPSSVYELQIGCVPSGCKRMRTLRFMLRTNRRGDCAHFCTIKLSDAHMEHLFGTRVCLRMLNRAMAEQRDEQCALLGRTNNVPTLNECRVCSMMRLF